MAYMYNLTSLTGRKRNVGRSAIVWGFEVRRRSAMVTAIAVGVSLIPTVILGALFGPLAYIITPAAVVTAAFVLVEGRSRKGLQLRLYQSILNKKKADTSTFYIYWRPVDQTLGRATIIASSRAVTTRDDTDTVAAVFSAPRRRGLAPTLNGAMS